MVVYNAFSGDGAPIFLPVSPPQTIEPVQFRPGYPAVLVQRFVSE